VQGLEVLEAQEAAIDHEDLNKIMARVAVDDRTRLIQFSELCIQK